MKNININLNKFKNIKIEELKMNNELILNIKNNKEIRDNIDEGDAVLQDNNDEERYLDNQKIINNILYNYLNDKNVEEDNDNIILLIEKRETIIFHYNKHHNEDTSTPPWIIKCKGNTYYINHMDILPGIGFSTNETPDNSHTKGALKIKGKIKIFKNDNNKIIAEIF
jgi:hypothetical protein